VVNLQLNKDALLSAQESILGNVNRIIIAPNIKAAPPTLEGIALRIAYNGKKYHSGTICLGVDIGSASI
jgi:hypothetical protein